MMVGRFSLFSSVFVYRSFSFANFKASAAKILFNDHFSSVEREDV